MAQDKTHQLLSLLLLTKDDLEMRGGYLKHQMDNINKAISIVEDSIRYKEKIFSSYFFPDVNSKKKFAIAIQKNWKKKYKERFDHPMEQADKVQVKYKKIYDIGKGLSINETNGEFLGIFKLSKKISFKLRNEYKLLRKSKKTHKFQIHDFFKYLIKKGINIQPIYVYGKYMEIDTKNDLKIAKKIFYEK